MAYSTPAMPPGAGLSLAIWLFENGVEVTPRDGIDETRLAAALAEQLHGPIEGGRPGWRAKLARDLAAHCLDGPDPKGWLPRRRRSSAAEVETVVSEARRRHAHDSTALVALLRRARRTAPLPSSSLAWVRDLDCGLWHAMDGASRRDCHRLECLGIASHMAAEELMGSGLETPHIDAGVESVLHFIDDIGLQDLGAFIDRHARTI